MEVKIKQDTSWLRAYNEAMRTVGKPEKEEGFEPSNKWKWQMLIAEHSPIKLVEYNVQFADLQQRVGVHFLRHPFVLPYIHTQSDERRDMGIPSAELPQGTPNDQDFIVNAQTLINISRKRLCERAHRDTREAWRAVVNEMEKVDPIMASVMVPNCVYRGFCPEIKSCGYTRTNKFNEECVKYRTLKTC